MKKMGLNIAAFFALILVSVPARAAQTQWTIVTTSESAPNAMSVSVDVNGDAINCSSQNPDNPNAWDAGHVGPKGDCYDPLIITFDLNMPSGNSWGPVDAAALDSGSLNLLSMTNSIGTTDGGVSGIAVRLKNGTYYVTVTNEDGSVFAFAAAVGADPMNASFTSAGGSSGSDQGNANVFSGIVVPSGTYTGQFDHGNFDTVNVAFGTQPSSDFALNTITITPSGSRNVCFTHTFSTSDPTAQSYGPNYVSGDVEEFTVGDGQGNVIGLVGTPGTNAEGVFSNPDATQLYLYFDVLASTNGSCAVGLTAYDSPFHRVVVAPRRPPIRLPGERPLWSR